MNLRPFTIAAVVAIAAMLGLAAWGWGQIPAGAEVAIHWGIDGQPNGYAPKEIALFILPAVAAGLALLLSVVPRFEPRSANLARSRSAYVQVGIALMIVLALVQAALVLAAVGRPLPMDLVVGAAVGGMFAVVGNVLGKVRSNYLFGVRTPWTLASDLSWNKTHRLVGRLFVLLGLGVLLGSLVGSLVLFAVLIVGMVAILAVAVGYSYRVWKADPDKQPIGRQHSA
jgi:uncharacterized membrane protein